MNNIINTYYDLKDGYFGFINKHYGCVDFMSIFIIIVAGAVTIDHHKTLTYTPP